MEGVIVKIEKAKFEERSIPFSLLSHFFNFISPSILLIVSYKSLKFSYIITKLYLIYIFRPTKMLIGSNGVQDFELFASTYFFVGNDLLKEFEDAKAALKALDVPSIAFSILFSIILSLFLCDWPSFESPTA